MKRLISITIILALGIVLACAVGCSKSGEKGEGGKPKEKGDTQEEVTPAGQQTGDPQ